MEKSLVIVESPAKARTINKYLGRNFVVKASLGHIKNLPENRLGVDIKNDFKPEYVTIKGKSKFINEIKKAAKDSSQIYIATDPDREGEAIAWHIAQEIKPKNGNIYRVLFNEITKKAVETGINNPGKIDLLKVDAQQARRIMDRIVGYQISPFLWKTLYSGLSAGRVQSVALRLICDKEQKIKEFTPEEYWSVEALLKTKNQNEFYSTLIKKNNTKISIPDKNTVDKIVDELSKLTFRIIDIKEKKIKRKPEPPFITSSLQQEASKRLGLSTSRIMKIAQQLYEGIEIGKEGNVGLITYMRTDSVRIADEARNKVRKFIEKNFGNEYLSKNPRIFKNKNKSQDAHEAIRPTYIEKRPDDIKPYLTKDQYNIYRLIFNRFVASQMAEAVISQKSIDIEAGDYLFRTACSTTDFNGFLKVFQDFSETEKDEKKEIHIPEDIKKGEILSLIKLIPKQHFTQPPPRYTESSLVKELDNLNIGRPSTYAIIITTLLQRNYIEKSGKKLIPTELGLVVNKILVSSFPEIFNVKFTAKMEEELDKIENGIKKSINVLKDFYTPFSFALEKYKKNRLKIKKEIQEFSEKKCELCGAPMIVRWSKSGKFLGCSNFPKCKYTMPLSRDETSTNETCPECGSMLVIKNGKYGEFLSCSRYPECRFAKPLVVAKCPEKNCNGDIISRKGKKGRIFYSCSNYPECKFISRYKIVNQNCPYCDSNYLEKRKTKGKNPVLMCPKCKKVIK